MSEPRLTINPGFSKFKRYPSLATIATYLLFFFLIYAFFAKLTFQFYASFLFLFYSVIGKMWIAVMCLGIFQTLLLLPLRIINLRKSANIKEFKHTLAEQQNRNEQQILLRRQIGRGSRTALFYWVNFMIQTVSYVSLGRLFLTDFYRYKIDPDLLYSFVPYPEYPIQSLYFKLPYVWFSETRDFGVRVMLLGFLVVIGLQVLFFLMKMLYRRYRPPMSKNSKQLVSKVAAFFTGSVVLTLFASYLLTRHFPIDWSLRIFSGDVSRPYPRFNLITAIATATTIVWLNLPKISNKARLAREAGIPAAVISVTQKEMLKNTLRNSLVLGLGAYFITNRIPSAFELSIFTLEIISWTAPLTIDRAILGIGSAKNLALEQSDVEEKQPETSGATSEDHVTGEVQY